MKKIFTIAAGVLVFAGQCLTAEAPAGSGGRARHVVMIVWDGMRPDFVTKENTPVLFQLAREGVNFRRHHPVYLSSTEVNGTALATGVYPARSGIMANKEYRPEINLLKPVDTQSPEAVYGSGKSCLGVETLAEILHGAGRRTAVAGTKPVALLQDYAVDRESDAAKHSVNLFGGKTVPADALAEIVGNQGVFPLEVQFPNATEDTWTTKALTDVLWKEEMPEFSVLWLSEPDFSQHQTAPGSEMALAAIKADDGRLGDVLAALEAKGVRKQTDLFIVSDHGFSTVERSIDLEKLLSDAGFKLSDRTNKVAPQPDEILMVGNGGSVSFYISNHDAELAKRLVEFLQQGDFAGVLFSRLKIAGTFGLEQAHIDTPAAPDVVLAFRWNDAKNKYGVPGMVDADGYRKAGKGTHASLSRYEMHNTLVAAGPDFRRGYADDFPTGNIDLAPTILRILGVKPPAPMDGRVLVEALATGGKKPVAESFTKEASCDLEKIRWHQFLKISRVGSTDYFDEGTGGSLPK